MCRDTFLLSFVRELTLLDRGAAGDGWSELGLPPNFDSCARDTYPAGAQWGAPFVLRALGGVAAAAAHLHGLRFTHGDLYAHNTMVTQLQLGRTMTVLTMALLTRA